MKESQAVRYRASVAGFALARTLGRVAPGVMFGPLGAVDMCAAPDPALPGPDWVRLEVSGCGVCGTDLSAISFASSPAMEPFASFPAVLGHEIVARVAEVGDGVLGLERGQRVSFDPTISCMVRGHVEPCAACTQGHPPACERSGEEGETVIDGHPLAPGLTVGFHRDLPGGMGARVIAHVSQVYPLPDEVGDDIAVLTEPLAVATHAVLRMPLDDRGPVLVIGSGAIALGVIWALRATGFKGEAVSVVKRPHEAEAARRLGADRTVRPGAEARRALLDTGARAYKPIIGPEVFSGGGFPVVFDGVGNRSSLGLALDAARVRGHIAVLGCAGRIRDLELSFLWARELEVHGFVCYGAESWRGESLHTFRVVHRLMVTHGNALRALLTHNFPLDRYREALRTAADHARTGAIKVVLRP